MPQSSTKPLYRRPEPHLETRDEEYEMVEVGEDEECEMVEIDEEESFEKMEKDEAEMAEWQGIWVLGWLRKDTG